MLEFWEPVPATAEILMERSTPRRPAPRLALLMDHSVEDPMPSLSISLAVRKSAPFVFPFYVDRHDLVLFSFFFLFFSSDASLIGCNGTNYYCQACACSTHGTCSDWVGCVCQSGWAGDTCLGELNPPQNTLYNPLAGSNFFKYGLLSDLSSKKHP